MEGKTFAFMAMRFILLAIFAFETECFQLAKPSFRQDVALNANGNENGFPNPFQDLGDMLSNMDDVIEDFMFKRMGNGEVFYGKRKFKPSGRPNTEGKYNGMGMSDKLKIDVTLEVRKELMERRRQQQKDFDQ